MYSGLFWRVKKRACRTAKRVYGTVSGARPCGLCALGTLDGTVTQYKQPWGQVILLDTRTEEEERGGEEEVQKEGAEGSEKRLFGGGPFRGQTPTSPGHRAHKASPTGGGSRVWGCRGRTPRRCAAGEEGCFPKVHVCPGLWAPQALRPLVPARVCGHVPAPVASPGAPQS